MKKLLTLIGWLWIATSTIAQVSDATLVSQSNQIKNETTAGANTATRVGTAFLNLSNSKGNKQEANTWTAKQTFTPSATVAGLNLGSLAGDPSTPVNGDLWHNSTSNQIKARINTLNRLIVNIGTVTASGVGYFPVASSGAAETEAGFTYDASTNLFTVPRILGGAGTPITSASASTIVFAGAAASGNIIAQAVNVRQSVASTGVHFGDYVKAYADHSSGTVNQLLAIQGNAENAGAGTVTDARGILGGTLTTNGPITNATGVRAEGVFIAGTGVVTNSYALYVSGATVGSGTVTNNYGVYQSGAGVTNVLEGTTNVATLYAAALQTSGVLTQGDYTPTITAVANIDATTAFSTGWYRVGNRVTVYGQIDADATAGASTTTRVRLSLPVASDFGGTNQAGGSGNFQGVANPISAYAEPTDNEVVLHWLATSTANQSCSFTFSYTII